MAYVAVVVAVAAPLALLGFIASGMAASFGDSGAAQASLVPLGAVLVVATPSSIALGYLLRSRVRSAVNETDAEIGRIALTVGWICAVALVGFGVAAIA